VEVYTVKAGDTLYAISQAYGVPVAVLMQVNRILNPYNLKIGQKICIPGRDSAGGGNSGNNNGNNSGNNNGSGTPAPVCDGKMHTIAKGDTLYMIAKKYQVPLAVIMRANPNIDPYNLKIGQQLCIPNFPPADAPVAPPATPPGNGNPILPTPSLPSCKYGRPYMTQRGDTLTRILDRFDITYGQLLAANPDIDFEGSLETLTLCIPYKDGETEDDGEMCTYTIQAGDTLDSISRKYGIVADTLLMANPDMTTADFTRAGTIICIPR